MELNGVPSEDTYAEAFSAIGARLRIRAENGGWAREAAASFTGVAHSVCGSGCGAGVEGVASETPDGRPGVTVLIFAMSKKGLHEQLIKRIGQSVMTCPSTACYNALAGESWVSVGGKLRFFGDGFQSSKLLDGVFNPPVGRARPFWPIPVMDGEVVGEGRFGMGQ